ncbi:MAG: hypothetical protein P4L43_18045 [Syntrophobacteraceae bacterium]|nr:hypothetical protein [Syntrophobacteraceae bacterium]
MMKHLTKGWGLALIVFAASVALLPVSRAAARQGPVVVGRISFIDGQLLRYVPEIKNWVLVRQDSPFGLNDALYSGDSAKAEFIFPNGLLARIDSATQIQLIALEQDASQIDLASGMARFYNRNPNGILKVTTPFGYVLAQPNSIFDLYVGDHSVQVIDLNGRVDYIQQSDNSSYELTPGGPSIIADASQVSSGESAVDAAWDGWNAERDSMLNKRIEEERNGESFRRLPPQLDYDARDLDRSGRWERVLYQGEYHKFWRPTGVSATWQPFTVGRWTDYYGDQVWVPEESFGYVTCHYGNWLHIDGGWYWAPPAPIGEAASGPTLAFGWYPGRVAWIGANRDVGWIPLAPDEPYYSHRHWGPASVMVGAAGAASIAIDRLAFASSAVIVPHRDFYSVNNYSSVRVTNINRTTIINNYRAAPVVNTVFRNYNQTNARYNFVNKTPAAIPYVAVDKRIVHNNQAASAAAKNLTAPALRRAAASAKPAKAMSKGAVQPPAKLTSKLVPPNQAKAPENRVKFKTLPMKTNTKPAKNSAAARPEAAKAPVRPVAPPVHGVTQPTPGVKHPPGARPSPPPPGMHPPAPPAFPKPPGHPPAAPPSLPPPGVRPPAMHNAPQRPVTHPPAVQHHGPQRPAEHPPARPASPPPGARPPAMHNAPQRPATHPPALQHHAPQRPAEHPPARPASPPPGARPPAMHNAPQRPAAHPPAMQHPAPPRPAPAPHPPAAKHPGQQDKGHHPER